MSFVKNIYSRNTMGSFPKIANSSLSSHFHTSKMSFHNSPIKNVESESDSTLFQLLARERRDASWESSVNMKLEHLEAGQKAMRGELSVIHNAISGLQKDMSLVYKEIGSVHKEISSVHKEISSVHKEISSVHKEIGNVHRQTAIQTRVIIGGIGLLIAFYEYHERNKK